MDLTNIDLSKINMTDINGNEGKPIDEETKAMIRNMASFITNAQKGMYVQCDEECRKNKKEELLFQDYLQAKQTSENAPRILEESEKNFYTFSKGGLWYQNMMEDKQKQTATEVTDKLMKKYTSNAEKMEILINKYRDQEIYKTRIDDLMNNYSSRVNKLDHKLANTESNSAIENRRTFYNTQKISLVDSLKHMLKIVYFLLVAVYVVIMVILQGQYKNRKVLLTVAGFIAYPYVIGYVFDILMWIYHLVF